MGSGAPVLVALGLFAFVAGFLAGCAEPIAPVPANAPVVYRLETDWEDVPLLDGERVLETNLGYAVGVRRLHLGVGLVSLNPCPEPMALTDLFAPSLAQADHSWDMDSSLVTADAPDALQPAVSLALGPAPASGAEYCEVFWTVSAADGVAADGTVLRSASAQVEGWWRAPGAAEPIPLTAEVRLGVGALVALQGRWTEGARVELTRYPASGFDDLELETLSESEIAYEVARRLATGSTARFVR